MHHLQIWAGRQRKFPRETGVIAHVTTDVEGETVRQLDGATARFRTIMIDENAAPRADILGSSPDDL